jgi:hypothetical protein
MPPETDCEVGYGKPPKETRFKKGQSGNRRRRPRGAKSLATFLGEVLDEKVSVSENGRRQKITKAEAMFKQLVNHAVQGDTKAAQAVVRMMEAFYRHRKLASTSETHTAPGATHVLVLPDNHRDPRDPGEVAVMIKASDEHRANKQREQERQSPANENDEEVPDKRSSAA